MGTWTARFYSPEQQARLGVDEDGNKRVPVVETARQENKEEDKEDEEEEEWITCTDPATGNTYYIHATTRESVWVKPDSLGVNGASSTESAEEEMIVHQSDWETRMDEASGVPYYFNRVTHETSWNAPAELSASAAADPMLAGMCDAARALALSTDSDYVELKDGEGTAATVEQHDWEEKIDPASGHPYYLHRITFESRWEKPAELIQAEEAQVASTYVKTAAASTQFVAEAPATAHEDEWIEKWDVSSNRAYFYNPVTRRSQWYRPEPSPLTPVAPASTPPANSSKGGDVPMTAYDGCEQERDDGDSDDADWEQRWDPNRMSTYWHDRVSDRVSYVDPLGTGGAGLDSDEEEEDEEDD